jgi:hypothetical protein
MSLLGLPTGWIRTTYGPCVPDWLHIPPGQCLSGPRSKELLNIRLRFELLRRLEAVGMQLRIKGRRWSTAYLSGSGRQCLRETLG